MITKKIKINISTANEDRPIAHIVQVASQYESKIYIEIDNKKVNAKSIMGMMSLLLSKGEEITMLAEGKDETAAIEELEAYLS